MSVKYILAAVCSREIQAELFKSYLIANGIENIRIVSDNAGGAYFFPFRPSSKGIMILIPAKYEEILSDLINKYQQSRQSSEN